MKNLRCIAEKALLKNIFNFRYSTEIFIDPTNYICITTTTKSEFYNFFQLFFDKNQDIFKTIYPFSNSKRKDILIHVLNMLVANGCFDYENNYIINGIQNLMLVTNLLGFIPYNIEAEIWSVLAAIIKKHVRNLQVATDLHYLQYLFLKLSITTGVISDFIIEIIAALLNYSVEIDELKLLLQFFQLDDHGHWKAHSRKLLDIFCSSIKRTCPENIFAFSGQIDSLISIPPMTKWPIQNGFTFNAWIQMENYNHLTKYDKDKQYLYNFMSMCGNSCGSYFIGNCFIVQNTTKTLAHESSVTAKNHVSPTFNSTKDFVHCIPFEFDIKKWYMVTVVYVKNRWAKSEMHCYVNGELISRLETNWLSSLTDTFDNCSIGNSFCGQISALYLFQEPLNRQQIGAIYKLGPSYEGQFHYENETENMRKLNLSDKKALYDGKLYSSIVFLYDPMACDGQLCLESSPKNNPSYFLHSPHAMMIGDVKAIITHTLVDTMHSLGGLTVLYPLFQQINAPHLTSSSNSIDCTTVIDYTICSKLIRIIEELALTSHDACSLLVQTKGIPLIAFILTNSSRKNLNTDIINSFTNLVEKCEQPFMVKQIMDFIFFNAQLWITADPKVQATLYIYLATEFIAKTDWYKSPGARLDIVSQMLNILKNYYYVVTPYWITQGDSEEKKKKNKKMFNGGLEKMIKETCTATNTEDRHGPVEPSFNDVSGDETTSPTNYLECLPKEPIAVLNLSPLVKNQNESIADPLKCENDEFSIPNVPSRFNAASSELLCDVRPNLMEILNLRAYIILFLKQIIIREGGIRESEMAYFIAYLSTVNEYENMQDVLQLLINLAIEHPSSFVPAFDVKHGIRMIFKLLNFEQELVRVQALKLLGIFLMHSTAKRKEDVMANYSLYSLIGERILNMGPKHYTPAIHRTLMEISVEYVNNFNIFTKIGPLYPSHLATADMLDNTINPTVIENDGESVPEEYHEMETSFKNLSSPSSIDKRNVKSVPISIENSALILVVANILREFCAKTPSNGQGVAVYLKIPTNYDGEIPRDTLHTNIQSPVKLTLLDLKIFLLSDLAYLFTEKPENKRKILQMSVWQEWLLGLLILSPKTDKEIYVTQTVLRLLASLIHHAIKYEYGGWRVWVDTMSILHSLVSKYEHSLARGSSGSELDRSLQTPPNSPSTIKDDDMVVENHSLPEAKPDEKSVPTNDVNMPFKTPEFRWSELHLLLLSDLLNRIERDVDDWKRNTNKNIIDIVNYAENQIFVQNSIHFLSQMLDNFIVSTGGVIQLLACTTTSNFAHSQQEGENSLSNSDCRDTVLTPARLMAYLIRMINLVDVFVFASSVPFHEMESEKSIPQGGILRQCLRLACICCVRNCLENQYRKLLHSISNISNYQDPHQTQSRAMTTEQDQYNLIGCNSLNITRLDQLDTNIINLILGGNVTREQTGYTTIVTPNILDTEVLLQNIDITRLKAIIYRDIEETKQAQFLALCVMYFVSVLTVSKYRDLLDPLNTDSIQLTRDTNGSDNHENKLFDHYEQHVPLTNRNQRLANGDADITQSFSDKSDKDRSNLPRGEDFDKYQNDIDDEGVESIKEGEIIEMRLEPLDDIHESHLPTHQGNRNEDRGFDLGDRNLTEDYNESSSPQVKYQSENMQNVSRDANLERSSKSDMVTKRIERVLASCVFLLKEVLTDFLPFMTKVFLGSQGQELLKNANSQALLKDNSILEFIMMLCSQEWQNSLQKHAGSAFLELINEGRILSHAMKDHVLRVSNEAEFILNKTRAEEFKLHADFEQLCAETQLSYHDTMVGSSKNFISSETNFSLNSESDRIKNREYYLALKYLECSRLAISNKYPSKHIPNSIEPRAAEIFPEDAANENGLELVDEGIGVSTRVIQVRKFKKLDLWENDVRMRKRLIDNPIGSTHLDKLNLSIHDNFSTITNPDELVATVSALNEATNYALSPEALAESLEKVMVVVVKGNSKSGSSINTRKSSKDEDSIEESSITCGDIDLTFVEDDDFEKDSDISQAPITPNRKGSVKNVNISKRQSLPQPAISSNSVSRSSSFTATGSPGNVYGVESSTNILSVPRQANSIESFLFDTFNQYDILISTKCQMISLGLAVPGSLAICKNCLYFQSDARDEITNHRQSINNLDSEVSKYLEINFGGLMRWEFADVTAIFARRYLLQNNALELFLASNTSVFLTFDDRAIIRKIISYLPRVGVGNKYGIPQRRRTSLLSPKQLFKSSNMTERWTKRQISNFDYLMFLNTIAGRSYQDLNQYPIFPWILSNYESSEIDLNNPINYRDLTQPVGALNTERKKIFRERFKSWEHHNIPPFHYGTHYSTAAFVLNWLLRIEPFTSLFINLHGGKFDHPNRIFSSLKIAWLNCQRDTSDVKELIPELFYFPEMFCNVNSYRLASVKYADPPVPPASKSSSDKIENHSHGGTDTGELTFTYDGPGDVELPPWCHGDPKKFVNIHRQALESEIVSCNINRWIDLIFGYKQRGQAAAESTNVFYYLTYEGNFNINDIPEPTLREALINQIKNFGQTPSQLLDTPHHPRQSLMHISPRMFTPVKPDEGYVKIKFPFNASIIYVAFATHPLPSHNLNQYPLIVINSNFAIAINKWNADYKTHSMPPSFAETDIRHQGNLLQMDPYFASNAGTNASSLPNNSSNPLISAMHKEVKDQLDPRRFTQFNRGKRPHSSDSIVSSRDGKYLILAGFRDKSFRVFNLEQCKTVQVVFSHRGIVTCVARSHSETFDSAPHDIVSPCTPSILANNSSSLSADLLLSNKPPYSGRLCGDCSRVSETYANFNPNLDFYLATGSTDTTIKLWRWCASLHDTYHVMGNGLLPYKMALDFKNVNNFKKISPYPIATLTGHDSEIVSIKISSNLGIVLSYSKRSMCLLHDTSGQILNSLSISSSRLTRSLNGLSDPSSNGVLNGKNNALIALELKSPHDFKDSELVSSTTITQIEISMEGDLLICYHDTVLHVYNVNGYFRSEKIFPENHVKIFKIFTHHFVRQILAVVTRFNVVELYDIYDDFRHLTTHSIPNICSSQNDLASLFDRIEIKFIAFSPFTKYIVLGLSNGSLACFLLDPNNWIKSLPNTHTTN